MPSAAASPTPYPYVNTVLQLLLKNAQSVLDTFFIGLYLHGSLALGDFDPGHSDIDFVVVTTRELPLKLIADLEAMHARIKDSGLEWADKLEGSYVSKKALRRYSPDNPPRPRINEYKFSVDREKIDSVINRYILRESGVAVAGPPIKPLIAPVSPDELRQAVVLGIHEAWTPRLNDSKWLVPPGHQPYLVVTCCRALFAMKFGTIASKPVSARWALTALDKQWTNLIETAMAWHYGEPHGDIEKSLQLIRYTMEQIGALNK